jgi:30S ribosomal protein S31
MSVDILVTRKISILLGDANMGKGDLRTRRGKIYNGSHGKKRPGKVKKAAKAAEATSAPARATGGRR